MVISLVDQPWHGACVLLGGVSMQKLPMQINPHAVQPAQAQQPKQPPAQAARDVMAAQPDLTVKSFGELVSEIARGQPITPQGG